MRKPSTLADAGSRCPACGDALRPWRLATSSEPRPGSHEREVCTLARCGSCGTAVTVGPPVEPEGPLYGPQGAYRRMTGAPDRLVEPLRRLTERDRMRFLRDLPAGSRVLEVGAGDGRFLARMAERGLRVSGIEPLASGAPSGVALEAVPIERATVEAGTLDAAVAWHVLEHLDDPSGAVCRIRDWLAPGGVLIVGVPNLDSLQARIGGDRWFHQDVPRHRTHFTVRGMVAMLEAARYEVEGVSHHLFEHNPLGMWQTLLNLLTRERDVAFRLMKRVARFERSRDRIRDIAITSVAGPPLVPFAVALEAVAAVAGRGGTVAVVARRA